MHIGIDANEANLTSHRVGVNQYAFDLLSTFEKLPSSHTYTIYLKTPPLPDLPRARPGWEYRVIPFPKLWTQTRLPWDLYTHSPRPDVFFSMTHYAPRFSPIPTVVAIMDLGFLKDPQQFTRKDFNQLKSWTEYSVRQAKKIIAISEFTKRDIQDTYKRKPEDIIVTYPGYDESTFKPTPDNGTLKKYGIKKPYFLFLSSLKPSKNVERLIRAFSQLEDSNYQLVIAGKKAWMFDQIFTQVKELGLTDRVIFTGFVDEAEVPILMTQAHSFVLASLFEGFGIPVVEAMACGTPVVVSRVASLPEVAGDAAIYVDPLSVDSIAEGLKTAAAPHNSRLSRAGLKQASKFSWKNTAQATLRVLEQAAG